MQFTEKITVRLPVMLKRKLNREARARARKPTDLAREILFDYLQGQMKKEAA